MGQIGSMWYNIGAKTDELEKNLSGSKEAIKNFGLDTADGLTRAGANFSVLGSRVDELMNKYKSSTPANLKYAQSITDIDTAFQKGKITSQQAATQLQAVKDQMTAMSNPLDNLKSGFQQITGISLSFAGAIGIAGMALQKTIQFLKECESAANDSNIVMAKQEAILKATGYAAGISAEQLGEMAQVSSKLTGIDDELIANSQSVLLTFRNIGEKEFPRAQQAALDLQTTFGDLNSSSMQLGKALNDPIKGVTALGKAGVTFSDVQKEQIKNFVETNQLAKAQAIILSEVEHQVGGTAEAIEKASDGTDALKVAQENYKESVGQSLTSLTKQWNDYWIAVLNRKTGIQETQNRAAELGFKALGFGGYQNLQNGKIYTDAYVESLISGIQASTGFDEGIRNVGYTTRDAGIQAQITEKNIEKLAEAEKAASEARQEQYSTISGLAQNLTENEKDLKDAEKELADYIKSNPWDNKGIEERKNTVEDLKLAQQDMVDKWMLNVYTQMLTADGDMSQADIDFLLQYQINTGMISIEAAARAQDQYDLAQDILDANGLIQESNNNMTGFNVVNTVTTYMNEVKQSNSWANSGGYYGSTNPNNLTGHASGGMFEIPSMYGNEGFRLGNGDTASAGEGVRIIPKNEMKNNGMSDSQFKALLESTRPNYDQMANAFANALSRVSR
jgi:hypothetical protein